MPEFRAQDALSAQLPPPLFELPVYLRDKVALRLEEQGARQATDRTRPLSGTTLVLADDEFECLAVFVPGVPVNNSEP